MSERMIPIPFDQLMNWLATELQREGTAFGVHRPYWAGEKKLPIFGGEWIETPFGPAAGPNTQLAQNIIASYFAGARFFELKTVQKMDGADLAACVNRPCILAEDECYNCEWSTELYVPEAYEEYVKAWFALKILAKVYGLGDPNGFVFNMSVGYDLAGIQGEKVNKFITEMPPKHPSTASARLSSVGSTPARQTSSTACPLRSPIPSQSPLSTAARLRRLRPSPPT